MNLFMELFLCFLFIAEFLLILTIFFNSFQLRILRVNYSLTRTSLSEYYLHRCQQYPKNTTNNNRYNFV